MPRTLFAQLHLQAVSEECDQVISLTQISMRLYKQRLGDLFGFLRNEHLELDGQLNIARADLGDLFVQGMQHCDSAGERLITRDRAKVPPEMCAQW